MNTWKYLILTAVLCMDLAAADRLFRMPGWEYEERLPIPASKLYQRDNIFIKAEALGDRVLLFHKSSGLLYASVIKDGEFKRTIFIVKMDKLTDPIIKKYQDKLYILYYKDRQLNFISIDEEYRSNELHKFGCPFNFSYDFFAFDNVFIITHPMMKSGKYSITLKVLVKFGMAQVVNNIEFPPLKPFEKGHFFPQISLKEDAYTIFYLSRHREKESRNINDTIFKIVTTNILNLPNETVQEVRSSGFSQYPPTYFESRDQTYVIFPSKQKALYQMKLISLANEIEYDISDKFINAFGLQHLKDVDEYDLFYISHLKNKAYISYKKLDFARLNDLKYMRSNQQLNITDPKLPVHYFTVIEKDNIKYMFFSPDATNGRDNVVYFSQSDRSSLPPKVKMLAKTTPISSNYSKRYFDFIWEEPDDPSGIAAYASEVNIVPDYVPQLVNHSKEERFISTVETAPGKYYLHILSIDNMNNPSAAVHIPFEITTNISAEIIAAAEEAERLTNEAAAEAEAEAAMIIAKQTGAYSAFLDHIRQAEKYISEGEYILARENVNLASVILPERMEPYFVLQLLESKESKFTYRYKVPIGISVIATFWMIILMTYLAILRRR